jgi:hypothetical protein
MPVWEVSYIRTHRLFSFLIEGKWDKKEGVERKNVNIMASNTVFWVKTSYCLEGRYQHSRGTYSPTTYGIATQKTMINTFHHHMNLPSQGLITTVFLYTGPRFEHTGKLL